ncbi:hypothetical protein MiAbW_00115 [Microcystis aeruginosa NIES-4325]|uniref:Uncharacterized protein n=1 Tax=Microcystis aeruginosa NIES-4325 TaxID=2569534 RepID=A0A5J4F3J6_MICAE|nr:hypothetical protein MiAbW_00115 [Microcystis aeruginosa NIES-4325]
MPIALLPKNPEPVFASKRAEQDFFDLVLSHTCLNLSVIPQDVSGSQGYNPKVICGG